MRMRIVMRNHLKYIFYIELIVQGEEIKRFINMCRKDDIIFIHIKYDRKYENRIIIKVTRKDFFRLRKYIRLTHVHIKVIKKACPRYYIFRYRTHYSFLAGAFIMFMSLKVLGMFIWQIDCYGNYTYTDETIKRYMSDNGISCAKPARMVDCDALEKKIRDDFDVTWACVAIKGSRVIVYIKENYSMNKSLSADISPNYNDDENSDHNIYSMYSGEVYSIITREGMPLVHVGDEISSGQLLVDGIIPITDDSGTVTGETYVRPDADILIKTVIPYEDTVDVEYDDKLFSGRKRYRLILENEYGQVKAGPAFNDNVSYDTVIEKNKLNMPWNIDSKVMYGLETQCEYDCVINKRDEKECNNLLRHRLDTYIKHIEQKGVQIMDCRVNIDATDKYYRCSGELEILIDPGIDIR